MTLLFTTSMVLGVDKDPSALELQHDPVRRAHVRDVHRGPDAVPRAARHAGVRRDGRRFRLDEPLYRCRADGCGRRECDRLDKRVDGVLLGVGALVVPVRGAVYRPDIQGTDRPRGRVHGDRRDLRRHNPVVHVRRRHRGLGTAQRYRRLQRGDRRQRGPGGVRIHPLRGTELHAESRGHR